MSMELEIEVERILGWFSNNIKRRKSSLKNTIHRAMRTFEGHIMKTQMSGRPGLKVQSGHLRDSWGVTTNEEIDEIVSELSTRVEYAAPHQYGKIKRRNGQMYDFPKRLHVPESFDENFDIIFVKEIEKSLKRTSK